MKEYPNPSDRIIFIHSHPNDFKYNAQTGLITVRKSE